MRRKSVQQDSPPEKLVRDIRRATRKHRSVEEKIRIVLEGLRGDAGPCEALKQLAQGADLLVHWCYRLSHETASAYIAARSPAPADIAAMAQQAGVQKLVVTHFRPHMDAPGVHESVLAEMNDTFAGEALIAEDLLEFEV